MDDYILQGGVGQLPKKTKTAKKKLKRGNTNNKQTNKQIEKTVTFLVTIGVLSRRAFLKRTENFSGPKILGLFSGEFLGSQNEFLKAPENTSYFLPNFSDCLLGFLKTPLHCVDFLSYASKSKLLSVN